MICYLLQGCDFGAKRIHMPVSLLCSWLDFAGPDISCKSAVRNASDDDPQAQDGAISNVVHNPVNPDYDHTDIVTVGLPELHKVLISLLEPLQARLEQLLQAQQGALPPPGPNAPEAVVQEQKKKPLVPSCSRLQRSKLHSQNSSMFDGGKTFRYGLCFLGYLFVQVQL